MLYAPSDGLLAYPMTLAQRQILQKYVFLGAIALVNYQARI